MKIFAEPVFQDCRVAVILAVAVMMIFAEPVNRFIDRHPTMKMLALGFLLLIGVNLIAEGVGFHIPKDYTYFAMGFSLLVEMLNLKIPEAKAFRGGHGLIQLENP
jgi:predicted tellurium resistance membrane protein TerC